MPLCHLVVSLSSLWCGLVQWENKELNRSRIVMDVKVDLQMQLQCFKSQNQFLSCLSLRILAPKTYGKCLLTCLLLQGLVTDFGDAPSKMLRFHPQKAKSLLCTTPAFKNWRDLTKWYLCTYVPPNRLVLGRVALNWKANHPEDGRLSHVAGWVGAGNCRSRWSRWSAAWFLWCVIVVYSDVLWLIIQIGV